jgi:hypothetical protein
VQAGGEAKGFRDRRDVLVHVDEPMLAPPRVSFALYGLHVGGFGIWGCGRVRRRGPWGCNCMLVGG